MQLVPRPSKSCLSIKDMKHKTKNTNTLKIFKSCNDDGKGISKYDYLIFAIKPTKQHHCYYVSGSDVTELVAELVNQVILRENN